MIHYLRELNRSGLLQSDLIRIVLVLVRSVCEYGCPVWSTGLTKGQSNTLKSIQKTFKIILPKQPQLEVCEALQISTLKDRHDSLCKNYSNLCVTLVINCPIWSHLKVLGVEVRPIQVLPIKGAKYRTTINFYTEGIIDNYCRKAISLEIIFSKINDQKIFIRPNTTIKVGLLHNVKKWNCCLRRIPGYYSWLNPLQTPVSGAISQKSYDVTIANDNEIIKTVPTSVMKAHRHHHW